MQNSLPGHVTVIAHALPDGHARVSWDGRNGWLEVSTPIGADCLREDREQVIASKNPATRFLQRRQPPFPFIMPQQLVDSREGGLRIASINSNERISGKVVLDIGTTIIKRDRPAQKALRDFF